jgi:hypothetical protein
MTKMRLLKPHWRYNKQVLQAGDIFDALAKDVKVIELSRIAVREEDAVASAAKKKRGRPAGSIQKAGQRKTISAKAKPTRKGRYQRRDMQAEK